MLEDLKVILVSNQSDLVLSDGLVEIILGLIEQTYFDQSISLSPCGEGVCQNGILEVADSLLDLVGLGKDHSKLVQDFTLLVEVGGHLQDSY